MDNPPPKIVQGYKFNVSIDVLCFTGTSLLHNANVRVELYVGLTQEEGSQFDKS